MLLDTAHRISGNYQVRAIPHTLIIGKDGIIKNVHLGFSPDIKERLGGEIDTLLAGKELKSNTYDLVCKKVTP